MRRSRGLLGAGVLMVGALAVGTAPAAASPSGGAIPPPITLVVPIAGAWNVPDTAVGVALNLTVTSPVASGYAVVYPCGGDRPLTSNVNFTAGQTVPNFVIAGLGADGDVCIETSATTDVIVDLAGYVPAGSPLQFLPRPDRIVDTRVGVGVPRTLTAGVPVGFSLGAVAGVMNVTVTGTAREGYLTVYPCGAAVPATSTSNYPAGGTVPNLVVAAAGAGGNVCVVSSADTDLVVDLAATLPAGYSGMTMLASPQRIVDTRVGLGGLAAPVTAVDRVVQVVGAGVGVPSGATAAIVNLTGTRAAANGFVSAYPCGGTSPTVSNLNVAAGADVANAAIVKLAADGSLCLRSNTTTDVIVDVAGYVQGSAAIVPVTPDRIFDSRRGVDPTCNLALVGVGSQPGLQWFDVATGRRGAVLSESSPAGATASSRIVDDCQHAWISGGASALLVDRSGAVVQRVDTFVDGAPTSSTFFAGNGVFALRNDSAVPSFAPPTVIDLLHPSDRLAFDVPSGRTVQGYWNIIGASSDLETFVFLRSNATESRLFVYDGWGQEVTSWLRPAGAVTIALSPDGTYISYESGEWFFGRLLTVVALDGTPVANAPFGAAGLVWATDGATFLCTPAFAGNMYTGNVAQRWDLFGAPTTVQNMPCAAAAG